MISSILSLSLAAAAFACGESEAERIKRLKQESFESALRMQNHYVQQYQEILPAVVEVLPPGGNASSDAIGSAFFINEEGFLMTCRHVVAGSREVTLRHTKSKIIFPARVFQSDADRDIAVLKAEFDEKQTPGFTSLFPPEKHQLRAGAFVLSIGAPNGLAGTMTPGQIAHELRMGADPARPKQAFIQVTMPVFPGSSGSPLVDLEGRLVGMLRFHLSAERSEIGSGFAIPADDLFDFAETQEDLLGLKYRALRGIREIPYTTPHLMQKLDLPDGNGVLISEIEANSPAERAGLKRYDMIREVDGEAVTRRDELMQKMQARIDNEFVELTIFRDGDLREIRVGPSEAKESQTNSAPLRDTD